MAQSTFLWESEVISEFAKATGVQGFRFLFNIDPGCAVLLTTSPQTSREGSFSMHTGNRGTTFALERIEEWETDILLAVGVS